MTKFVIDYFELPTSSTTTSSAFYAKAFGWGDKPYGPGYSEILDGGVLGGLNAAEDKPVAPLIGIRTDDLVAAQSAIEAAGGTISVPAEDYPGGRRFQFREPGGAQLLVYCPAE